MSLCDHQLLQRLERAVVVREKNSTPGPVQAKIAVLTTRCPANLELPPCADALPVYRHRQEEKYRGR